MARKVIDIGVVGNDGTGDSIRDSFRKVNDNFRELFGALGLGENLSFLSLEETPNSFAGEANSIVSVNDTASSVVFKQLVAGAGIAIDFGTEGSDSREITITNTVASISADTNPRLGGDLKARSGARQFRILELPPYSPFAEGGVGGPTDPDEAVSKSYADSKISVGGIDAIDPETGESNSAFGVMTGPLILSRSPVPDDDERYGGLIAATKSYVDNAGFGSIINLYVATSGNDARVGVGSELQGRALSYAYRTLESALKRAEEIVRAAPPEIGPYRKVLTWTTPITNVTTNCFLSSIVTSPDSGTGFAGDPLMSIDAIRLGFGGFFYRVGDILFIDPPTELAGVTQPASIRVLTINAAPGGTNGPILTFEVLTGGVYFDLPEDSETGVATSTNSANGEQARFIVTYKVNNVRITDNGGTISDAGNVDYGLVSVRVTPVPGDTGTGAFGFADVVNGQILSITITDGGSNFKALPTLDVDLPRFRIYTGGQRTDFTGDVSTETLAARRGRDIREGLYLRGEQSGALAQILSHSGELDSEGNELFDVDIKYGTFLPNEEISYGDVANTVQITILVESGIYLENLPLKVPQNVSIVGDEFRRVIIRPKPGISSSPYAFQYFRRDLVIDGLPTARNEYNRNLEQEFGYHYLSEADKPVYPLIDNKGFYRAASRLLEINKQFIQDEVVAWIDYQISNNIVPFVGYEYNDVLYKRDIAFIIDALAFDLLYSGQDRTISAALKHVDNLGGLISDSNISQNEAAIKRVNTVAQSVIKNKAINTFSSALQIIDLAFVAESGVGGLPIGVSSVSNSVICTVTTSGNHGFSTGEIITFNNVGGATELNGNTYHIDVLNSTQFQLYQDQTRSIAIDSRFFGVYTTGGTATPNGGVVNALLEAMIDVISNSNSVNYPLDNDQMDVFLMNDATILRSMSIQGNGGFAMVLDPTGQILAKSPYAQEGATFSKSTGRQTLAGGQFIDGFTGNLKFKILNKISNTRLEVGQLNRFPQLPASYIVDDTVYRINYVRDYVFNTAGSTATLVLDETTPWPFPIFQYNAAACSRDVNLIVTGLGYDIALGTNYHARKAGNTYRLANATVVIDDQLGITVRAIEYAHLLADQYLEVLTPATSFVQSRAVVESSNTTIKNILRRGVIATPTLNLTNPPGLSAVKANAKDLLLENIEFIREEVVGYIEATYPSLVFESAKFKRDVQYAIEAVCYDIVYGGNSQTRDAGLKYYDGTFTTITQQFPNDQRDEIADSIAYAKILAQYVVQNTDVGAVGTLYTSEPQVFDIPNPSDVTTAGIIGGLMDSIVSVINSGVSAAPAEILPSLTAFAYDSVKLTARTTIVTNVSTIQTEVLNFIDTTADVYEILMPGNRSMLSNDFTQINDMGYGLLTTNGGLAEAVSMFTYYNYTSYYSLNGGQIRSVGGSSAHGVYALVSEGSDPLEVPTPVDCYYNFSQGAVVYNDGSIYGNALKGLVIYVGDYEYPPLDFSEIEIDHGGIIGIARYPVTTAATEDGFPTLAGKNIYRLNISSDSDGLLAAVPDGSKVTLRLNTQLILTGDIVGVATRPSTALKLNEATANIYRVLNFDNYAVPPEEIQTVTITVSSEAIFTTASEHNQLPGYIVRLDVSEGGTLPAGLNANEPYYILDEGFSNTTFKLSETLNGTPLATTTVGSGTFSFTPSNLAVTKLREGYDYVEGTIWARQPYVSFGASMFKGPSELQVGTVYKIVKTRTGSTGTITNFTLVGASSNTVGTVFTATGTTTGTGEVVVASQICTFDAGTDTVEIAGHGFNNGDVIRFETESTFNVGLFTTRTYFVYNKTTDDFQVVEYPGSTTIVPITSTGGSTIFAVGKVIGRAGDSIFAINPVGTNDRPRIIGMQFNFKGENYTIQQYDSEAITGEQYGLIYITPALSDSVVAFASPITLKMAVPSRVEGSQGTLTIRISLTRATGHDFLEIGTGSYADTNYPNEIYGPPVRLATELLLDTSGTKDYAQVVERGEGRTFFVTTDQFGNFSVGPFFRVDQGTGTVTFSASIALSNLDGLGFKRGVPISEFSTDTSMSDNATDTVPTENATRTYIDRRLGIDHEGNTVPDERVIPVGDGGFVPINGQRPMKADLDLGTFKAVNVADPEDLTDAVNLRSIRISNIQDFDFTAVQSGSIFTFTGASTNAYPAQIDGDIFVPEDGVTTGVDSTLNKLNVFIKPNTIDNANINSLANILQSKLALNGAGVANSLSDLETLGAGTEIDPSVFLSTGVNIIAGNRYIILQAVPLTGAATDFTLLGAASNDEGTTFTATANGNAGSGAGSAFNLTEMQSRLGLAAFNGTEFTSTNGWISLKNNGVPFAKMQQISADTVIGRSASGSGNVSAIPFSTVVDEGFGIKKNQYSATGFLRRTGATNTLDADYGIVDMTDAYVGTTDSSANGRLVVRSSLGDFGGRTISASVSLRVDARKAIDTTASASGGTLNYYGFGTTTTQRIGITIGDGSLTTDRVNTYLNNNHLFRNIDNTTFAPIQASQITASTFTTGGAGTSGNLTGNLFLTTNSNLTLGTGVLDAQNGTFITRTLNTGDVATTGTVQGDWSLTSGSRFVASAGTLQSTNLTSGAVGTQASLTGDWRLSSGSIFNADSGTLRSRTLSTGSIGTSGTVTGTWSLSASSVFDASPGTLKSTTLTTGAAATAGSITGNWSLTASSILNCNNGTLQSDTLTTGDAGTSGSLTGNWSMIGATNLTVGSGSIDARTGTLYARSLHAGTTGTTGTITGAWTVSGSLEATSITGQANSATITASSANTLNNIVRRDGTTGGFTAGNITTTQLQTTVITTGGSATTGTVTGRWSLSTGSRFEATYADLAEYYEGDKEYEVGTVLVFGGDMEVTLANKLADTRVAGVVSENAAYTMNKECQGLKNLIALQGRVPCRVVGKVRKGDLMVTSKIAGVAVSAGEVASTGTVIGKALQNYDSDHIGTIEIAVGRT